MFTPCRTPEGEPLHCDVCGHDMELEVSPSSHDATCVYCGALLWQAVEPPAAEATSERTRHAPGAVPIFATVPDRVQRCVRRLHRICQADPPAEQLWPVVLHRMVEALDAAGGALWETEGVTSPWTLARINLSLEISLSRDHELLLLQPLVENRPLRIPPFPFRSDNPTPYWLLLVPVPRTGQAPLLIEIFQHPDTTYSEQVMQIEFLVDIAQLLRARCWRQSMTADQRKTGLWSSALAWLRAKSRRSARRRSSPEQSRVQPPTRIA